MFEWMTRARDRMSRVDTAWLRMERPTNLMMITGVMVFDGELHAEDVAQTLRERFMSFPRFRQRPRDVAGVTYWEDDPDFDIHTHLRRIALPGDAGHGELQELVSDLASTPLDPARPMWQFHLVENYVEGPAIITRIHHCYADGIALIQVMLSLTDTDPKSPHPAPPKRAVSNKDHGVIGRMLDPAKHGVDNAIKAGQRALDKGKDLLSHPGKAAQYAEVGAELASELGNALTLADDPPTRFRGRLGVRKRAAWTDALELEEVKAVAKSLGCTVNDVLLASVTGALRAYLLDRGDSPDGLAIRATVPVNLRPLEHAKELGNHFGLVFLSLPIGHANPLARLYAVRDNMNELKSSKQAVVAFGLLAALGMGPSFVQRPALELFSRKATAVMTNVPGPQRPLYLAGAEIKHMMFWVPQSGGIGMGVSILSYNGKVEFGLITDRRLVPDPEAVIERFAGEFEKLLLIALMDPLDRPPVPEEVEAQVEHACRVFG